MPYLMQHLKDRVCHALLFDRYQKQYLVVDNNYHNINKTQLE